MTKGWYGNLETYAPNCIKNEFELSPLGGTGSLSFYSIHVPGKAEWVLDLWY